MLLKRAIHHLVCCLVLAGCVPLGSEGVSVQVDPSGQNQGAKNLEAVREIWADQRLREANRQQSGQEELSIAPPPSHPLPSTGGPTTDAARPPIVPLDPPKVVPPLGVPQRKSVPVPPRPNGEAGVPSGVTVPPYTVFAPVGSAYPDSIRCVPDALGGQRCRVTP